MTSDEHDIAAKIRAGDPHGFHLLYDLYADRVMGFVLRLSGSRADAEDIVQEVFVAAWKGRESFQGRARLLTWLLGIASRRWRDRCRAQTLPTLPLGGDANDTADANSTTVSVPADTNVEAEVVDAITLSNALVQLDAPFREALLLVVSQGLTYKEAAQVMDEPIGTTKWRVAEATRRMSRMLNAVEEEFDEMQRGSIADCRPCHR